MKILGIETSFDETAAAVIQTHEKADYVELLSHVSPSSIELHAKTGGAIPEIAAREQLRYILPVIKDVLAKAEIPWDKTHAPDIDAIAITYGPGLIGSLLVGVETAKTLALVWDKPLIPVNHLFGHIYANWIYTKDMQQNIKNNPIVFPAISLIISGGHTDLILMKSHHDVTWLGGTRDDAAGEALDKIGRLLQLPYPGGPAIEKQAKQGNPEIYHFPRPMIGEKGYDFSFSGLKTAVLREVQKTTLTQESVANIASASQASIFDVLIKKTLFAAEEFSVTSIILGGGVSANMTLRDLFQQKIQEADLPVSFYAPAPYLSTDNAAMIASAAHFMGEAVPWQKITANPELYFD